MSTLPTLDEVESSTTTAFLNDGTGVSVWSVAILVVSVLLVICCVAFCVKVRKKWGKHCWCFNLPFIPVIIRVRSSSSQTSSERESETELRDVSISVRSSGFLGDDNNYIYSPGSTDDANSSRKGSVFSIEV